MVYRDTLVNSFSSNELGQLVEFYHGLRAFDLVAWRRASIREEPRVIRRSLTP